MGHVLATCYVKLVPRLETFSFCEIAGWRLIYSFHMPLFMFVSGFVSFDPNKNYKVVQIVKRVASYLIPFFVVGVMLYEFRHGGDIFNYWYLRSLSEFVIGIYVASLVINKLSIISKNNSYKIRSLLTIALFMLAFTLVYYLIPTYTKFDIFLGKVDMPKFIYFGIGWYIRRCGFIRNLLNSDVAFFVSAVVMFVYLITETDIEFVTPMAGIILIWNIAKLLVGKRFSKPIIIMGRYTLEIYLFHFFILFSAYSLGEYFSGISSLSKALSLQFFYSAAVSVPITCVCVAMGKVIRSSKLTSFFLLGDLRVINNRL